MIDQVTFLNILLTCIGFLVIYTLNGIKGEITGVKGEVKEVRDSMDRLERELSHSITDLDKRVAIIEKMQ